MAAVLKTSLCLFASLALITSCRRADQDRPGQERVPDGGAPSFSSHAPTAEELTRVLGVPVELARGEVNQYLIRAPQGSADLGRLGTIHTDLGYAVGLTLKDGTQIGFRYEPPPQ